MTWNYKIFQHIGKAGEISYFGLHETYYNSEGEICGISENPDIMGNSVEEILSTLSMMLKDAEQCQEILNHDTIKFAKWT